MKPADWSGWLERWLARRPLRAPIGPADDRFRNAVLSRIRAEETPAPVVLRWVHRPRLTLALSGLLAAALTVAVRTGLGPSALARETERETLDFMETDGRALLSDLDPAGSGLEEDLRTQDRLVLAQATAGERPASEEARIGE